jgi:hypothetical protein
MLNRVTVIEVFIASPADALNERVLVADVIRWWNAIHGRTLHVFLSPVMWETHATPQMGQRAQAIINKDLVASCDVLVGIFRDRLGTPTGVQPSGTAEEIEEFKREGKPVMLYFPPIVGTEGDVDTSIGFRLLELVIGALLFQWVVWILEYLFPNLFGIGKKGQEVEVARLRFFREQCEREGLVAEYASVSQLREQLLVHLTRTVNSVLEGQRLHDNSADDRADPTLTSERRPTA